MKGVGAQEQGGSRGWGAESEPAQSCCLPGSWVESNPGLPPTWHVVTSIAALRLEKRGVCAGGTSQKAKEVGQDGGRLDPRQGCSLSQELAPSGIPLCLLLHLLENLSVSL